MKTKGRRLLSIVLTICMMIPLVPSSFAVSAKDFTDVASTAWYYDSAEYVTSHGYFNGTGDDAFSPDASMTRAMFVTVLARLDGAETAGNTASFTDVTTGFWCADEVAWAANNNIVSGVGGNRFAPDEPVSRQH